MGASATCQDELINFISHINHRFADVYCGGDGLILWTQGQADSDKCRYLQRAGINSGLPSSVGESRAGNLVGGVGVGGCREG